jgi:TonB family protein
MKRMDCVVAGVPACLLLGCVGRRNLPNKAGRNACRHAVAALTSLLLFVVQPLPAQRAPNDESARLMRLERFVLPEFPPFLRHAGLLQGTVVAAIGHDEKGRADDILILETTDPRFSDAVLDAVREWRFKRREPSSATTEDAAPVVRFLFTTGSVSVVPLTPAARGTTRRAIRAETPIELPNFSHLDQVPAPLHQPPPEFPATLRARSAEGSVVVKYFVDATGKVRLPSVISATKPEFGAAALAAIRQWRYAPPRIDGQPVVALERHSFHFNAAGVR